MKRFIMSVLFVSVFCIGLGALVDKVGAKFKSDEKALALIRQARQAIGGDASLTAIKSLSIVGKTTRTVKIEGVAKTDQSETEINLSLPGQMMRMEKMGKHEGDAAGSDQTFERHVRVEVNGDAKDGNKTFNVVTKGDGAEGDAVKFIVKDGQKFVVKGGHEYPVTGQGKGEGAGAGEGTVTRKVMIRTEDGTVKEITGDEADKVIAAHGGAGEHGTAKIMLKKADGTTQEVNGAEAGKMIVRTTGDGNATFTSKDAKTVHLNGDHTVMLNHGGGGGAHGAKNNNDMLRLTLSLLLTAPEGMDVNYQLGGDGDVDGIACNVVVAEFGGSSYKLYLGKSSNLPVMLAYSGARTPQLFTFRTKSPDGADDVQKDVVFTRSVAGPGGDTAEFQVKLSDYRSTGGVQLPYRWTQTVGGEQDETFDVTSYDINPANILEKFNGPEVKVRVKSPDGK